MAVIVNDMALTADEFPETRDTLRLRVTLETVLYVALAILALGLRLAQLDHAPLNDAEAREALAALREVSPNASGEAITASSLLTFVLNAITFAFGISSNMTARLPIALGGVLLALSPVLWRRYLNPLPPLLISLLLTLSPVAVVASRTSSAVTWTMLLAIVAPWLVLRFVETQARTWAILATVTFGAMILLVEPAGFLVVIMLLLAIAFALLTEDDPDSDMPRSIRDVLQSWPWENGALALGMIVLVLGTGLFILPSGLGVIGNTIWTGLQGFLRRPADTPVAFPLWVILRYEPGLVLFGLLACYRAVREGGFFERFLVGWAAAGAFFSLAYFGASAAHALWLVVPLNVLVGLMITRWITERAAAGWQLPSWGISAHAALTLALWLAVGMGLILIGKWLLFDLPAGVTDAGQLLNALRQHVYDRNLNNMESITVQNSPVFVHVLGNIQFRLLISVLVALLNGVLFFLVGSMWGARAAGRGFALGTLTALLLFGYGQGWRAAYLNYDDPRELWYPNPVTDDIQELRTTLREMSLRDNGEPNLISITALVPHDGALAWALRDYPNTTYVDGVGSETNTAVVLMPAVAPQPALGADYVGKDLVIRQEWDISSLSWRDTLMWIYRSDALYKPTPGEIYMLWVRKEVYGVERVTEE